MLIPFFKCALFLKVIGMVFFAKIDKKNIESLKERRSAFTGDRAKEQLVNRQFSSDI